MSALNPIHYVNGSNMFSGYPAGAEQALLGMGCFTYEAVCTGRTGHAEVVHIVFDPKVISYDEILKVFFEHHDPTQGNRQGNDMGPKYRSAIFTYNAEQMDKAKAAMARYEAAYGRAMTTQLAAAPVYYPAESYHQQYLAKNPQGYCMHGPTGISCALPKRA